MRSFFDAAPEISKNVPMLIGSVTEEGNRMSSRPTEEEWHANLAKAYGDEKATTIVAALKEAYPRKKIHTLSHMCSGNPGLSGLAMRNNVVKMARLKHELKAAPAYAYYFRWQTPILDSLPGAWHTADLQFCFDNTKRCEQGTGNTPEAKALAKKMAASWAAFAATGNTSRKPGQALLSSARCISPCGADDTYEPDGTRTRGSAHDGARSDQQRDWPGARDQQRYGPDPREQHH
jgi:para-nitrobenzyl esterase